MSFTHISVLRVRVSLSACCAVVGAPVESIEASLEACEAANRPTLPTVFVGLVRAWDPTVVGDVDDVLVVACLEGC